jgi:hypothetical protein
LSKYNWLAIKSQQRGAKASLFFYAEKCKPFVKIDIPCMIHQSNAVEINDQPGMKEH